MCHRLLIELDTLLTRFACTWNVNSSCRFSGTCVYSWVARRSEWPTLMLASGNLG